MLCIVEGQRRKCVQNTQVARRVLGHISFFYFLHFNLRCSPCLPFVCLSFETRSPYGASYSEAPSQDRTQRPACLCFPCAETKSLSPFLRHGLLWPRPTSNSLLLPSLALNTPDPPASASQNLESLACGHHTPLLGHFLVAVPSTAGPYLKLDIL